MKAKFTKGQHVFSVHTHFAAVGAHGRNGDVWMPTVNIGVIIERVVDACGQKQMTFESRDAKGQNDSVFGRKVSLAWAEGIFANLSDAKEYLAKSNCDVICPDVYSDENDKCFVDFHQGAMRIAAK